MRASFLATKERLGDENFPLFLARHAIGARAMPLLESKDHESSGVQRADTEWRFL